MSLPISEWSYKSSPEDRHIGPMAQDFYEQFKLGGTKTGISSIDTGGVALAAIQGVKLEKDAQIDQLYAENERLKLELDAQRERLLNLELALGELIRKQQQEIHLGATDH